MSDDVKWAWSAVATECANEEAARAFLAASPRLRSISGATVNGFWRDATAVLRVLPFEGRTTTLYLIPERDWADGTFAVFADTLADALTARRVNKLTMDGFGDDGNDFFDLFQNSASPAEADAAAVRLGAALADPHSGPTAYEGAPGTYHTAGWLPALPHLCRALTPASPLRSLAPLNGLTPEEARELAAALSSGRAQLESLTVDGAYRAADGEGAEECARAPLHTSALVSFPEAFRPPAQARKLTTTSSADAHSSPLCRRALAFSCSALAASPTLTSLELGRIDLGAPAWREFGRGLASNRALRSLTINLENVGGDSGEAAAEILGALGGEGERVGGRLGWWVPTAGAQMPPITRLGLYYVPVDGGALVLMGLLLSSALCAAVLLRRCVNAPAACLVRRPLSSSAVAAEQLARALRLLECPLVEITLHASRLSDESGASSLSNLTLTWCLGDAGGVTCAAFVRFALVLTHPCRPSGRCRPFPD